MKLVLVLCRWALTSPGRSGGSPPAPPKAAVNAVRRDGPRPPARDPSRDLLGAESRLSEGRCLAEDRGHVVGRHDRAPRRLEVVDAYEVQVREDDLVDLRGWRRGGRDLGEDAGLAPSPNVEDSSSSGSLARKSLPWASMSRRSPRHQALHPPRLSTSAMMEPCSRAVMLRSGLRVLRFLPLALCGWSFVAWGSADGRVLEIDLDDSGKLRAPGSRA
jgi:hypothetical protein